MKLSTLYAAVDHKHFHTLISSVRSRRFLVRRLTRATHSLEGVMANLATAVLTSLAQCGDPNPGSISSSYYINNNTHDQVYYSSGSLSGAQPDLQSVTTVSWSGDT